MSPLDKAIDALGGIAALARAIKVKPSTPAMWKQRVNVPAEYCPSIERATNGAVRCEELRPDVDWSVLRRKPRKQKVPA